MGVKELFVSAGKLRAGWRMLIFLLISFPPLYFITLLLWKQLLLRYIIIFGLLLGISFLFAVRVDKRPQEPSDLCFILAG
jgi:phosphoglycerol transferase MdoB-like AlkP superfamily enzyme